MLNKIRQARQGLGMEDDTNNPEVTGAGGSNGSATGGSSETTPPVVDEVAAAADSAVDDASEAGESVVEDSEVIEELDDAKAALEEICEDMRISLQNGGMNPDMARMAKRYADRTLARVGMTSPMPSCEAFGGFGDRFVATSVSLEAIGDRIKEIWEKIKAWFNNMWKNIRTYWQKVWDAAPKLKARAEALRKKADDLGGKTATEKQIEVGADVVKKLYDKNGKLPVVAEMHGTISEIAELCKILFGDYYAQALKFIDTLSDKMAGLGDPTAANISALGIGAGGMVSPVSVIKDKQPFHDTKDENLKKKFLEASEVYTSGELFGGQCVLAGHFTGKLGNVTMEEDPVQGNPADPKPTGGNGNPADPKPTGGNGNPADPKPGDGNIPVEGTGAALKLFAKNAIKVVTYEEKAKDVSEATYATMALGEVQTLCDEVIKICDSITGYRKDWDKAEKSQAKIMRAGDNYQRAAAKSSEKGGNDQAAATALFDLTRAAGNWIAQPNQAFSRYAMEAAKAVLMVCDKSLAQYS